MLSTLAMWRQCVLAALAFVLAIPPARFALASRPLPVDRGSAMWKAREALLARAQVFVPSPPDPAAFDFAQPAAEISCHFVPKASTGTTPKFDCRMSDGAVVKVKYGWSRERFAETAATRLLTALGFGADRVRLVRSVRCYGCPAWPFEIRLLAEQFLLTPLVDRLGDDDHARVFEWVSVEEKRFDRAVEVESFKGWDWRELSTVEASDEGASTAELDALRLMAVFLAHWDTKAANQRLACLGAGDGDVETPEEAKTCGTPLLMLQDLGATFGPSKVEYDAWSVLPIWKDPTTCLVSMDNLPYAGDMFVPTQISERGRALLAERLMRLSDPQIHALFASARFPDPITGQVPAHDLGPWVEAFRKKVRAISGQTCPAGPPAAAGRV